VQLASFGTRVQGLLEGVETSIRLGYLAKPSIRASMKAAARMPDFERADRIGEFWGYPESRAFGELLSTARRTGRFEPCLSNAEGG
jgi:hypothetical protein